MIVSQNNAVNADNAVLLFRRCLPEQSSISQNKQIGFFVM